MKSARLFLGTIHLQNRKIVRDSVCKLAYDIPKRNISTSEVTIVSRFYDELNYNLTRNRKILCKFGTWLFWYTGQSSASPAWDGKWMPAKVWWCFVTGIAHFTCGQHAGWWQIKLSCRMLLWQVGGSFFTNVLCAVLSILAVWKWLCS